ncbi:hypothetical protein [Bacteriovorax sp. Seq25_V]|uniref:hypothetical protein n=1 Tax=Bacteriovorax sp. Seq25_V TaxID=1201288 RepID=UPI00038A2493|nr:hypothetical protein [Bacteriovorax sp. Seq25_V]EQC47972.1 hypothetical protein M900_A0084 [Bacteriovorax sp. Seq25_V]
MECLQARQLSKFIGVVSFISASYDSVDGPDLELLAMMRKLIVLNILLLITSVTKASEFSYIVGGITPHIQKPEGKYSKPLCNELSEGSGIIYTDLKSFRVQSSENEQWGFLVGENSYCKPIWGGTYSYQFYQSERVELQATVGFYHFDQEGFDFSEGAYFANVGNFYFVPIVGVEMNFVLYTSKSLEVKMMNLVTPVISHHSLGFIFPI